VKERHKGELMEGRERRWERGWARPSEGKFIL